MLAMVEGSMSGIFMIIFFFFTLEFNGLFITLCLFEEIEEVFLWWERCVCIIDKPYFSFIIFLKFVKK